LTGLPLVEAISPALDPWEACQRLVSLPNLLFLDSAQTHSTLGRYSFLTADPFDWLWARGQRMLLASGRRLLSQADPFAILADYLARWNTETVPGLPPFQGGAAGLFGYDLCHHLERLPRPQLDEFQVPDLAVGFYDWVLAHDHELGKAWLISTGFPETEPTRRRQRAERRLRAVMERLTRPTSAGRAKRPAIARGAGNDAPLFLPHPLPGLPRLGSNFDRAGYLNAVRRVIEYIHAGDCFQVNLSQRLLYPACRPALDVYRRLRETNPALFGGFFDFGEFVIASASPERFLRVENGVVQTRPIKGTRPRGRSPEEDQARSKELQSSPKDRAENIMIVDLLRNDLGRVCRYKSVRVAGVCRLETHPFVHHLVSEVRGELREGLGPVDLLRAAFPGGSVTGAPKVRAMQIIAELEPTARGPYCGSLGYLGFDGSMDTNILIRTLTLGKDWIQFPVGGGIVAESDPEQEYEETWHKAAGLLGSLQ
jgi:para-aminobenzoate synthetase component 1